MEETFKLSDILQKIEHVIDEEDDSFFELELTGFGLSADNKRNPEEKISHEVENPVWKCEIFSKRKIIPIDSSSCSNETSKSPISLFKSSPRLRVFSSKKPRVMASDKNTDGKLFTVKFRSGEAKNGVKLQKQSSNELKSRPSSKNVIQKYLKLIKPLYIKVSKRYAGKIKFSGEMLFASPASSPAKTPVVCLKEKQGNFPAGFKRLGKSKSTSTVIGGRSPVARRRDDSLLQQHDGIQNAILHCKRSFSSSRDPSMLSMAARDSDASLIDSARSSSEDSDHWIAGLPYNSPFV